MRSYLLTTLADAEEKDKIDGREHQEERQDSLVKESEIKETGSEQKDMDKNKGDLKLNNKRKKKKEKRTTA